jgi:hypothetical protein
VGGPPVEIAKRYVEALSDEDHDTAYALLDAEVEVVSPRRTVRGAEAVRARWQKGAYDHLVPEIDRREYAQQNGFVRATTYMTWRWKEGGEIAYRTKVEGDFMIRNGKIARIETTVAHEAAE